MGRQGIRGQKAWEGVLHIDGGVAYNGPAEYLIESGGDARRSRPIRKIGPLRFTQPGTYVLTVTEPDSGSMRRSHPITVTAEPPAEKLFWGDIHLQTYSSDGLRGTTYGSHRKNPHLRSAGVESR